MFEFPLFPYSVFIDSGLGRIMKEHCINCIQILHMFRGDLFHRFQKVFGHVKFKEFQVFDVYLSCNVVVMNSVFERGQAGAFYVFHSCFTIVSRKLISNCYESLSGSPNSPTFEDLQLFVVALLYSRGS